MQLFEGSFSDGWLSLKQHFVVPRTSQNAAEDFRMNGSVYLKAGELLCLCSCNKAGSGISASGRSVPRM